MLLITVIDHQQFPPTNLRVENSLTHGLKNIFLFSILRKGGQRPVISAGKAFGIDSRMPILHSVLSS